MSTARASVLDFLTSITNSREYSFRRILMPSLLQETSNCILSRYNVNKPFMSAAFFSHHAAFLPAYASLMKDSSYQTINSLHIRDLYWKKGANNVWEIASNDVWIVQLIITMWLLLGIKYLTRKRVEKW